MGVFIGLDVSLSKTAVCVVDRDAVVLWQGKVPSESGPLIARALRNGRTRSISLVSRRARCRNGCTAGCGKPAYGFDPDRSTIRQSLALLADAIDWSNAVVPGFRPVLVKRASK
jgi:hypothetical protein